MPKVVFCFTSHNCSDFFNAYVIKRTPHWKGLYQEPWHMILIFIYCPAILCAFVPGFCFHCEVLAWCMLIVYQTENFRDLSSNQSAVFLVFICPKNTPMPTLNKGDITLSLAIYPSIHLSSISHTP